jgi:hypothetical protein
VKIWLLILHKIARLPADSFALKLQETVVFAEWYASDVVIQNSYFSFMHLANNKKIYFASDQHFGAPKLVCQEKSDSWHGSMN